MNLTEIGDQPLRGLALLLDDLIDDATLEGLGGADGVACGAHLHGFGDTGDMWTPLAAGSPGVAVSLDLEVYDLKHLSAIIAQLRAKAVVARVDRVNG